MNKRTILITLLTAVLLITGGRSLYQLGLSNGMAVAPMATPTEMLSERKNYPIDPSAWGIPEGEQATRRHIESGLKGGDIDPLTGRKILYYHDPMVPGKKFQSPGKSPFMDMMLVPAYAGAEASDGGTIFVSSRIQQNLGVRTGEVHVGHLDAEISAVGTVAWNERGQVVIQARATGFVENQHVRASLDRVEKGQPLLDLYVPDWVAVQEDYLAAIRLRGTGLESLAEAARQRMRQAGMDETQISLVERTGQTQARMTLVAPRAGIVTELMTREGSTVTAGMPLMRINDLSSVWVQAEVPESQAARVAEETSVTAETPAWPNELFRGRLESLLPEVNPTTRTRKARMTLANPRGKLVPGMSVKMQISSRQSPPMLLVPSESLVRTGRRTLVIAVADEANGTFRPIEVQVGREANGRAEVLSGLSKGQRIVLSGQFLIDSEASLKGLEARFSSPNTLNSGVTPPSASINEENYRTTARVEAVTDDIVTLTHPEIPALRWPEMTMDFTLAPDVSRKLAAGSSIDVVFRLREGDMPQIIRWQTQNIGETGSKR